MVDLFLNDAVGEILLAHGYWIGHNSTIPSKKQKRLIDAGKFACNNKIIPTPNKVPEPNPAPDLNAIPTVSYW